MCSWGPFNLSLGWERVFDLKTGLGKVGWGEGSSFVYLSSYFALISLYENFHEPGTYPSWRKVCVGGAVEGNFRVTLKVQNWSLDFGLGPGS